MGGARLTSVAPLPGAGVGVVDSFFGSTGFDSEAVADLGFSSDIILFFSLTPRR